MLKATNHLKFLLLSSEFIKEHYLNKQCVPEVARLLSLEPVFDWQIVTELELSSLNILHIVGLRLVTNLRSLRLAHNRIQKIENLDRLTKLESLDLSLNRLTDIENLEYLTALKHLNVAGNRISVLNNLDGNVRLETFMVDGNRIMHVNQLFYMQRFPYLWLLNVADNPFTADGGNYSYRQLIVEQFPKLRYVDNKRVTDAERPPNVHESAATVARVSTETLRAAFLNDLDGKHYVGHLYDDDDDGVLLSKWNPIVTEAFETYKKRITEISLTVYYTSLKKYADHRRRRKYLAATVSE